MARIESRAGFDEVVARANEQNARRQRQVLICCGPGCLASGALELAESFRAQVEARGLEASVGLFSKSTGCQGLCERGPLVLLEPEGILYTKVRPQYVVPIIERTIEGGNLIKELLYKRAGTRERIATRAEIPFYRHQTYVALRNLGRIDPTDLDDALAHGAYRGLAKALFDLTPERVIEEITTAGLRGRGGAGFVTGRKWRAARRAPGAVKYILCNGDEGDPGAFKDRGLMEGDPHAVIEGMVIGGYGVGAREGFIYVRHEYPLAVEHLGLALVQARERGLLGKNILGSGFDFDIRISRGAGSFVCGESSALMRSLEGKVGEPRQKYIHATEKGLFDQPTVLNNVETWADVGAIIEKGGAWFAALGTEKSKGTKAFSLVGKVRNTGLIELPMGMTLRQIIDDIGGGIAKDRPFKAVQTGGPSGGCVPESLLDLPVDYEELTAAGSMMGSGGMIVMDDRTCMVDIARYFLAFLGEESCGKCLPCREGLAQLLVIYDEILAGRGQPGDIERIEALSHAMQLGSLCELGKSAPNPVLSTLRYFRAEYDAHIERCACPAGICRDLTGYEIDTEACDGCNVCAKVCPTDAISGKRKEKHTVAAELCISCGACFDVCPKDALRTYAKSERKGA